jgi:hypothetical protein
MNRLLVVGGASIDVLHLKDRTVDSAGGAAVYTAVSRLRSDDRLHGETSTGICTWATHPLNLILI